MLARISSWKNALLRARAAVPESDFEYDDVAREVYPEYEARLRAMCALDFDDLVVQPVQLLARKPDVRARWQERFEHVLVDEFQDTSKVQLELCKLLVQRAAATCAWSATTTSRSTAGAAPRCRTSSTSSGTSPARRIVKLEDNYRSRAAVLAVANAAIAQSSGKRHGKTLRAARGGGDKVRLCVCEDPTEEAQLVAREMRDLVQGRHPPRSRSRCCIARTCRRARSRKSCAPRASRIACSAARSSSIGARSRTWPRTCAC